MTKVYALISLLLLLSFRVFSQGTIAGKVTDSKTGEGVIGANVIIQGTTLGSATDIEGNFLINNVKEGTCTLQISSVMYKTHTVPNVKVETAKKITIDVAMAEDVSELQEVIVQGTRQTDTDFELVRAIKESKLIVVGITAEQIGRSLDRDAAQVLRRVPGVTIRGDQFVQIRGLSERYNPVILHNAYAPSVENDVRSFSFQTLPSNQLDKMLVFKSPSADLPGDFGGGIVKVFTKSIPEENGFLLEYSTQVRSGTTFSDFYHQQRDPGYLTGFNTGYYDLPAGFPANLKNASVAASDQAGKRLNNNWTAQKSVAIPDQRFSLTYSKKFHLGKVEVGNVSALTYSNSYAIYDIQRGDFTTSNNIPATIYNFKDRQYNQLIRTGLLFNWAFKLSPGHLIEFKNLYNQSSADQYVDRNGNEYSSLQHRGAFDKPYRGIYSGQLLGTHELFKNRTSVEWMAGYNKANRDQPDYRRYRQDLDPATGANPLIYVPNSATPDFLGRFYSTMKEAAYTGGISIKQRFSGGGDPLKGPELKAGMFFEHKTRDFSARNIGFEKGVQFNDPNNVRTANNALISKPIGEFFEPGNIDYQTGIAISENTNKKDSYNASNDLMAYYLTGGMPIGKFKIDAGIRIEDNLQKLNGYYLSGEPATVNNHIIRPLPSANLSYNFNEKMLVRAAYGETLNRPEFRELAPFTFFDFNYNFLYGGNPNLKTARIQNVDVRWELYPGKGELVTIGGFYKDFDDPIEAIVDPTSPGGGVKNITFQNVQNAKSYGFEVEVKKSLAGLTGSKFVNRLNFLFNTTLVNSQIKLYQAQAVNQKGSRPLQGQAPYVINSALFYSDDESGWQINLLYNVVGKYIAFVGNDFYADVYLMPRNVLDLTVSKRLAERFYLKAGISDILNQPLLFLQDGNGDGNFDREKDDIIQSYRPGQVFSIGFSWRF
jgi:outer membrane receptor protein involved in Fe transport